MLSPRLIPEVLVSCTLAACDSASGTPPDAAQTRSSEAAAPKGSEVERPVATVAAVENLQSAFKQAIARSEPAVVSVYSTKTVTFRQRRSPFGNDPLFDFFFRRPQSKPRAFQQQGSRQRLHHR